jgi:Mannosyltransferase (PIG-M)
VNQNRLPDRTYAVAAFTAVAVFVGTWTLLHVSFYKHNRIIDTPVYQRYGNEIAHGKIPYRDFELEYPPGALPMFALPGLAQPGHAQNVTPAFRRTFETLMWMCGAIALLAMALTLRQLRAPPWAPLLFAAVAPLALGSVILSRFDLWPAALTACALAALVSSRFRLGHALVGLGAAAKFYPGVLLPLAVAYTWKRRGRREALTCLALTLGAFAVVFLPFVVLAPGGVWHSVSIQLGRPLQVESLGAALLLVGHHVFGFGLAGETSHGSQNLDGAAADALGVASTVAQVAVLVWIWVSFARQPATSALLVRASAAAVCAFVAFGKVLSPQFLIWLIPVVPLVQGRRGLWAGALLLAALVLTQIWFPSRYFRLALDFEPGLTWVLLARDLTLAALALLLATSLRRDATRPEYP